jgi:hypothetical protein
MRGHIALQEDTAQNPPLKFFAFNASFRSGYVSSRHFRWGRNQVSYRNRVSEISQPH